MPGKRISSSFTLSAKARDGRDAERYWIEVADGTHEVRFTSDFAGAVTGTPSSVALQLRHLRGSTEETLQAVPAGYTMEYLNDGGEWEAISPGTRNTESDLSDGSYSPAVYRLRKGSVELGRVSIRAVWEYQRMLLPAGKYTGREYTRTPTTTPLVLHEQSGEYWFLVADTNRVGGSFVGPKDANQHVWQKASDLEVVLTKMLFAPFAQLGGFIVYGNYFFSRYGTLVSAAGAETAVDAANVDTQYAGRVPYGWFDSSDPMAGTVPASGYRFRPSKCINALTGEEWAAGGKVHFSANGDVQVTGEVLATRLQRTLNLGDGQKVWKHTWSQSGVTYDETFFPSGEYDVGGFWDPEEGDHLLSQEYFGNYDADILYIGSHNANYTVMLPPPSLCVNRIIELYFADTVHVCTLASREGVPTDGSSATGTQNTGLVCYPFTSPGPYVAGTWTYLKLYGVARAPYGSTPAWMILEERPA